MPEQGGRVAQNNEHIARREWACLNLHLKIAVLRKRICTTSDTSETVGACAKNTTMVVLVVTRTGATCLNAPQRLFRHFVLPTAASEPPVVFPSE